MMLAKEVSLEFWCIHYMWVYFDDPKPIVYVVYVVPTVCRSSYLDLLLFSWLKKATSTSGRRCMESQRQHLGRESQLGVDKSMSISKSASEAYIIYHISNLYIHIYMYIYMSCIMSLYIYIQIYREIDRYVNDVCVFVFSHICISMLNP